MPLRRPGAARPGRPLALPPAGMVALWASLLMGDTLKPAEGDTPEVLAMKAKGFKELHPEDDE